MSHIRLDARAAALLQQVQKQTGPVSHEIEQALTQAAEAQQADAPLSAEQVEKALLKAMPDQKELIKDAGQRVKGYHPDQTNAQFLTQILETRVVKEHNRIEVPARTPTTTPYRDPYYTNLQMDPKADVVLLFNARDVDKNGRPLLMKIVARERADLSKLDLSQYRTRENQTDISKFDVERVKDNADYLEVKDTQELEFQFGDPLKQVSLDKSGGEISTSVKLAPENTQLTHVYNRAVHPTRLRRTETVGGGNKAQSDGLDRQAVARFDERIRVTLTTKDTFPEGAWLDDKVGQHISLGLHLDRGFVFEPGALASVKLLGTELKTNVPPDDAQLLGSPSQSADVTMANQSLRWLLGQPIQIGTHASATGTGDAQNENKNVVDVLFANKAHVQVAGAALAPMTDYTVPRDKLAAAGITVAKKPLVGDAEKDGQQVSLTLGKGFLTAADGEASVEGWKVIAGFTDHEGKWQAAKPVIVEGGAGSQEMSFSFELPNAAAVHQQNKNLEVRVFNKDGIPAERVLIPFREVGWADGA